jgi:hypothetical protein
MTQEEFDKMIRGSLPPVAIGEDRLERFIDNVLDAAAARPAMRTERRGWNWPVLLPVLRFAVPMVVAVLLGVTVGRTYEQEEPVAQFSTLYLSTTLVPVGS